MSVGPIPWRDINCFADDVGLCGLLKDCFIEVIMEMDNHWLAEQRREMDKKSKK